MAAISWTLGFCFSLPLLFFHRLAKSFIEIIFKRVGCWEVVSIFVKNHSSLCMEDLEFILCPSCDVVVIPDIFLFMDFWGIFGGFFVRRI